jgi:glycerol uptake facilitator-like aquaporin
MRRAVAAEFLGSLLLTATVVGSGLMGERLADGNLAVALLANTGATVAMLATLIAVFGPISGAHFNPVVTLVALWQRRLTAHQSIAYVCAQFAGCCAGALLANAMFGLPIFEFSTHVRTGSAQWLSEVVATGGLIFVAFSAPTVSAAAWRVSAWIGAAYWFTASTSFANPAITLARSLSDSFTGIRPTDAPEFIAVQLVGAASGAALLHLFTDRSETA